VKEILGFITVALALVGFFPYFRDILKGKTKPHLFTYLIWTVVTFLAFFGQVAAGAGPGAWTTGTMALLTVGVLALSFKYGTEDIKKVDAIFLAVALLAIVPWWLTHNPTLSVVIATIVDVCAFFPTIRKTFNDPSSETLISYVLNLFRHSLALFALSTFALATYIYPAALLFMNVIMVFVIVTEKRAFAAKQ
jgi:hypothetical protein